MRGRLSDDVVRQKPERHRRSVITCDLEGRIETYNAGAEALFGYAPEEVIGRKRVSIFSPGPVVLAHVGKWLDAALRTGEHCTRTVFLRKDGTPFAADIRITPTFRRRNGEKVHVGYCGLTEPLPTVSVAEAMPAYGGWTRLTAWLVVTRAPFLTATLVPLLLAWGWVSYDAGHATADWPLALLAIVSACALHVAANTFNDYFDWRSGVDQANNDYFVPYSGGSRAVELGLASERGVLLVALGSVAVAVLAAVPILLAHGPVLLAFGAAGLFLAYYYTAPPLKLSARRGLGELGVVLAFGPLMVAGMAWVLTGVVQGAAFLVGLPVGLLTGAILWINEFPDADADARLGKRNLVVTLGRRHARWGYVALVAGAYGACGVLVAFGVLPSAALAVFASAPLAVRGVRVLFRHYRDRHLVAANRATIWLHGVAGGLLCAGTWLG